MVLPSALSKALDKVSNESRIPLKHLILAAHLRAIAIETGCSDVSTGLVVNGRPECLDGNRALGLFLNVVPHRLELGKESWLDLARMSHEAEISAVPYRRFPLATLQREAKRDNLLQSSFNFVAHSSRRASATRKAGTSG